MVYVVKRYESSETGGLLFKTEQEALHCDIASRAVRAARIGLQELEGEVRVKGDKLQLEELRRLLAQNRDCYGMLCAELEHELISMEQRDMADAREADRDV